MADSTNNYELVKPASSEKVDIAVINGNMDKIDKALSDQKAEIEATAEILIAETNSRHESEAKLTSEAAVNRDTLGYQRKNLLRNTAASTTQNGVTFTVNNDGSVLTSGTASTDTIFVLGEWLGSFPHELKGRELLLSGCPQGGSNSGYRIAIHTRVSSGASYSGLGADTGNGFSFSTTDDFVRIIIRVGANVNADDLTFYPMLRYSEITDDTYEPYKPSVEERLAALEEKFIALISLIGTLGGSLGGILVSSKMTNYRLQQLESRVAEHNNFARRMPVIEEQIKVINHRIEDIERNGQHEK